MVSTGTWRDHFKIDDGVLRAFWEEFSQNSPLRASEMDLATAENSIEFVLWCVQKGHFTEEAFTSWQSRAFEVPIIRKGFFESPVDMQFWDRVKDIHPWSATCVPLAEWDEVLLIGVVNAQEGLQVSQRHRIALATPTHLREFYSRVDSQGVSNPKFEIPPLNLQVPPRVSDEKPKAAAVETPKPAKVSTPKIDTGDPFAALKSELGISDETPTEDHSGSSPDFSSEAPAGLVVPDGLKFSSDEIARLNSVVTDPSENFGNDPNASFSSNEPAEEIAPPMKREPSDASVIATVEGGTLVHNFETGSQEVVEKRISELAEKLTAKIDTPSTPLFSADVESQLGKALAGLENPLGGMGNVEQPPAPKFDGLDLSNLNLEDALESVAPKTPEELASNGRTTLSFDIKPENAPALSIETPATESSSDVAEPVAVAPMSTPNSTATLESKANEDDPLAALVMLEPVVPPPPKAPPKAPALPFAPGLEKDDEPFAVADAGDKSPDTGKQGPTTSKIRKPLFEPIGTPGANQAGPKAPAFSGAAAGGAAANPFEPRSAKGQAPANPVPPPQPNGAGFDKTLAVAIENTQTGSGVTKTSTGTKSRRLESTPVTSFFASSSTSKNASGKIPTGGAHQTKSVAVGKLDPVHLDQCRSIDEAGAQALLQACNIFETAMILLFKDGELLPWKWNDLFLSVHGDKPMPVDLTEPSIFKVVFRTAKPYHGYVVTSDVNQKFFNEFYRGMPPKHATVIPVMIDGRMGGMLLGFTNSKIDYRQSLRLMERLAFDLSRVFKSLRGTMAKAG